MNDDGLFESEESRDDRCVPDVIDEDYTPAERPLTDFDSAHPMGERADLGTNGTAASAEEAAVHIVPE